MICRKCEHDFDGDGVDDDEDVSLEKSWSRLSVDSFDSLENPESFDSLDSPDNFDSPPTHPPFG